VREISIPSPAKRLFGCANVLPFLFAENADPSLADLMPFHRRRRTIHSHAQQRPTLAPGTNLQVVYQIWTPAMDPRENLGKKLDVEYAFGRPAAPAVPPKSKTKSAENNSTLPVPSDRKKLSLEQQSSGSYILNVTVNNPETKHNGFATMNFKVLDAPSGPEPWDVLEPGIAHDAEKGISTSNGALLLGSRQFDEARIWFRRALQLDHSNDVARARLVDAYFSKKDYAAVVSLFSDAGVTEGTDSETLLRIATSLEKRGSTPQAISVIEMRSNLALRRARSIWPWPSTTPKLGNPGKAADLAEKGKSLLVGEHAKQ